jgi:alpha-L-fucosidase
LPGLASRPRAAHVSGSRDGSARYGLHNRSGGVVIEGLSREPVNPHCTVVWLTLDGAPDVYSSPEIAARGSEFIDPHTITLSHPRSTDESPLDLRYTLDGSDPAATSPAYDGPFNLSETTTIRVQAWRGQTPLSPIAERTFTKVTPMPPVALASPQHGFLRCEHFEGTWQVMPRFDALTPVKEDTTPGLTLDTRTRDEHFAQVFTGFLYIRTTGVYQFALTSDDGSRLFLHDRLVIDNDGLHAAETREGTIALEAGYHPVRVEYFNRTGARALTLRGEYVGRPMIEIPARGFVVEGGEN